jgi:putative hydrolase of the HAD superfamily
MTQLKNIKAIVFDLDDTLYLQKSYKESGFLVISDWLEKNKGIDSNSTLEHLQQILDEFGPSYPIIFNFLIERLALNRNLLPELIKLFLNHEPKIQCFPGVKELLAQLKNNYKLGLLTDGREAIQRKKVRCLGLDKSFDAILFSDSMGLTKPAVRLYTYFEEEFQLNAYELVYVGDNPTKDFIGAKERGWLTIRIRSGEYSSITYETEYNPHFSLNRISDIQHIL